MAQLFPTGANTVARLSLLGAVVAPVGLIAVLSGLSRSPFNTKVTIPLDQPVPFSHEHHVTELGIDCRYCHTSVEKSAYASLPATHTCMSCHSQIWTNSPLLQPIRESYRTYTPIQWNQVNKVPEFVYFNHSIHINRGLNCNNCHGPVEKMPLTWKGQAFHMVWCLNCHRNPEKFLFTEPHAKERGALTPREQVFDIYWKYQEGEDKLSPRERALMEGETYSPSSEEIQQGEELVKQYGVKKAQLADCWICHR